MTPRTLLSTVLIAVFIAATAPFAVALDENIVFVDLDRVFNDYHKTQLADAQLKDQADEYNLERKEMFEEYEALEEEFNGIREDAQNMALSEEVRNEKRDLAEEKLIELRQKERNIRRFEEQRRKQLDEQQRRMRKNIVKEIRESIETYARDRTYTAVIDSSGQSLNGVETILYLDIKRDITDDILEMLNRGSETEE